MLFTEKPEFVWGLIASMYTGNVIGVAMVLAFVPLFAAILRIPFADPHARSSSSSARSASYAVHNSMVDIWYMLVFGVIGYVFKKLDYPLAPLVLALVLGDLAENALRQSLIMSQGSLLILFERPISGVISAVALFFFALPLLHAVPAARAEAPGPGDRLARWLTPGAVGSRAGDPRPAGVLDPARRDRLPQHAALGGQRGGHRAGGARAAAAASGSSGSSAAPSARSSCGSSSSGSISLLLRVPYLRLVGGLLLIWIAFKLVRPIEEETGGARHGASFWESIWIIVVADITMSLDNVLAVAAAAHGDMLLVTLGIAHVGARSWCGAAGSSPG